MDVETNKREQHVTKCHQVIKGVRMNLLLAVSLFQVNVVIQLNSVTILEIETSELLKASSINACDLFRNNNGAVNRKRKSCLTN